MGYMGFSSEQAKAWEYMLQNPPIPLLPMHSMLKRYYGWKGAETKDARQQKGGWVERV